MKTKQISLWTSLFVSLMLFIACSDDDDTNSEGSARMSVELVDAPGDYEEVNIDVQDVVIKYNSDDEAEFSVGEVNANIYNLLELTGGASAVLADDEEIPSGDISQIRLVLGSENTIVVNGETHSLQTPSAEQSGLKINLNQSLESGIHYEYILDFDVEHSIVEQGNGGYLLKPVIRASAVAETGSVTGTVLPSATPTLVTATSGEIEVSTYTNASGEFELQGLPEGSYTVTLEPDLSLGFEIITLTDIEVTNGEITSVGEITFE